MGWQDRDYNSFNRIGDARFGNPIMNFLFGSFHLFTAFGIRVRVHASLVLLVIFDLLFAKSKYGLGFEGTAAHLIVLFTIILLHEFGHCFAGRSVGGDANEILLWPLGGLAYAGAPHRPWPTFVTVAGGPLVNVIICVITGLALYFMGHFSWTWMNPLLPWGGTLYMKDDFVPLVGVTHPFGWLYWFFTTSASLFFFNLLPIYPLDGGQMLQAILWKPMGYRRSMKISCITGMVGSGVGFILGLISGSGMLIFLAVAGFMTCYQRLLMLRMTQEEEEPYDLSAAWEHPDAPKTKRKKVKKRWLTNARKRALQDQAEQARIDAILAKVKEKGLHSLTWWEKRTLRKATERQRQHDLAERR